MTRTQSGTVISTAPKTQLAMQTTSGASNWASRKSSSIAPNTAVALNSLGTCQPPLRDLAPKMARKPRVGAGASGDRRGRLGGARAEVHGEHVELADRPRVEGPVHQVAVLLDGEPAVRRRGREHLEHAITVGVGRPGRRHGLRNHVGHASSLPTVPAHRRCALRRRTTPNLRVEAGVVGDRDRRSWARSGCVRQSVSVYLRIMATTDLVLDALGDPTRRAVFERVLRGPVAVGMIASGLPVSRPAVSQHLGVLKRAGLVVDRPSGRHRVYEACPTPSHRSATTSTRSGTRRWRRSATPPSEEARR